MVAGQWNWEVIWLSQVSPDFWQLGLGLGQQSILASVSSDRPEDGPWKLWLGTRKSDIASGTNTVLVLVLCGFAQEIATFLMGIGCSRVGSAKQERGSPWDPAALSLLRLHKMSRIA